MSEVAGRSTADVGCNFAFAVRWRCDKRIGNGLISSIKSIVYHMLGMIHGLLDAGNGPRSDGISEQLRSTAVPVGVAMTNDVGNCCVDEQQRPLELYDWYPLL